MIRGTFLLIPNVSQMSCFKMRFKESTDHISISLSIDGHSISLKKKYVPMVSSTITIVQRFHQHCFKCSYPSSHCFTISLKIHSKSNCESFPCSHKRRFIFIKLLDGSNPCFFRMHCGQIWFHIHSLFSYMRCVFMLHN